MLKLGYILSFLFLISSKTLMMGGYAETRKTSKADPAPSLIQELYDHMQLHGILKFEAFEQALSGQSSLVVDNKDILTIIDFSLPSTKKRLYVLDLKNKKIKYHSLVSHGRNSGENFATSFSNEVDSHQSSLGFYTTGGTYQGRNGYSLVLNGLEPGINNHAKERAVVIHGADYCSQKVIASTGRLGRSYGCPALPQELSKPIINSIKNGTLLYIYADNKEYASKSEILGRKYQLAHKQKKQDDKEHYLR